MEETQSIYTTYENLPNFQENTDLNYVIIFKKVLQ